VSIGVHVIVHTVVEVPSYIRAAEAIFTEAERAEIVSTIAADPQCGDLIQGTGGFRKVRVRRGGIGKRGGARVVYILRNENFPVFLIAAYAKNEKANLSKKERNDLARLADEIFVRYGGRR
jgi:hypothetical protein